MIVRHLKNATFRVSEDSVPEFQQLAWNCVTVPAARTWPSCICRSSKKRFSLYPRKIRPDDSLVVGMLVVDRPRQTKSLRLWCRADRLLPAAQSRSRETQFVLDATRHWQPAQLLAQWRRMCTRRCIAEQSGSSILNTLQTFYCRLRASEKQTVTIDQAWQTSARTSVYSVSCYGKKPQKFIPSQMWPPNSPDLNPVDYSMWGLLQENVTKHVSLTCMNWNSDPQSGSIRRKAGLCRHCGSHLSVSK